eukprot:COSAG04_NODE_1453_length_6657_cov_4.627173_6_plen_99_part_00
MAFLYVHYKGSLSAISMSTIFPETLLIKFFFCQLSIVLIQFSHARRPSSLSLGQMARPAHEAAPAGVGVGAAALEAPALRRLRQSCARALLQREPLES